MVHNAVSQSVRVLSDEVGQAGDPKLLRITRMIDMMPERGEADLLLAPFRLRLAALRPSRPMNPSRLLFIPFDPVLVPARDWRMGDPSIPRSIIRPVSALILGDTPVPPGCAEATGDALTRGASSFWSAMADKLRDTAIPESWAGSAWQAEHGFTRSTMERIFPVLQLVLRRAHDIRSLPPAEDPACSAMLTSLLGAAASIGPLGWGIMLGLLFEVTAPDLVTNVAAGLARGHRQAPALHAGLDQATGTMLDRMETQIGNAAPGELLDPRTIGLRVGLIGRVEALRRLEHRASEQLKRVGRLRQALAATNRQVFEHTLQTRLGPDCLPTGTGPDRVALDNEAMRQIEAEARQMRRFALVAAKLGDGDHYERLLGEAASRTAGGENGLTPIDRMRLTELLIGSDKALQLFGLA